MGELERNYNYLHQEREKIVLLPFQGRITCLLGLQIGNALLTESNEDLQYLNEKIDLNSLESIKAYQEVIRFISQPFKREDRLKGKTEVIEGSILAINAKRHSKLKNFRELDRPEESYERYFEVFVDISGRSVPKDSLLTREELMKRPIIVSSSHVSYLLYSTGEEFKLKRHFQNFHEAIEELDNLKESEIIDDNEFPIFPINGSR